MRPRSMDPQPPLYVSFTKKDFFFFFFGGGGCGCPTTTGPIKRVRFYMFDQVFGHNSAKNAFKKDLFEINKSTKNLHIFSVFISFP